MRVCPPALPQVHGNAIKMQSRCNQNAIKVQSRCNQDAIHIACPSALPQVHGANSPVFNEVLYFPVRLLRITKDAMDKKGGANATAPRPHAYPSERCEVL